MSETRKKLFTAALELFGTKGYDAVSIRELTRSIGIKESSFYNHYKSKAALLEAIFAQMDHNLASHKPTAEYIDQLTDTLSLKEYLQVGFSRFMEKWQEPHASKIWAVVSMEQYRNPKAARLVLRETERVIQSLRTAFAFFQQKQKMKTGDPLLLANIYGFATRALHLDYSLRSFLDEDAEARLQEIYATINAFADRYAL